MKEKEIKKTEEAEVIIPMRISTIIAIMTAIVSIVGFTFCMIAIIDDICFCG